MVSVQGSAARADGVGDGQATGPQMAPEVIDQQAIERLRQLDPGGQSGVLDRVLRAYQASLSRYLTEIVAEPVASDPERVARAAHTLKSSSAAVGAMGLAQRCADIEVLVRSHKTLPPASQVEAMIHEGRLVLAAVATMLGP